MNYSINEEAVRPYRNPRLLPRSAMNRHLDGFVRSVATTTGWLQLILGYENMAIVIINIGNVFNAYFLLWSTDVVILYDCIERGYCDWQWVVNLNQLDENEYQCNVKLFDVIEYYSIEDLFKKLIGDSRFIMIAELVESYRYNRIRLSKICTGHDKVIPECTTANTVFWRIDEKSNRYRCQTIKISTFRDDWKYLKKSLFIFHVNLFIFWFRMKRMKVTEWVKKSQLDS